MIIRFLLLLLLAVSAGSLSAQSVPEWCNVY